MFLQFTNFHSVGNTDSISAAASVVLKAIPTSPQELTGPTPLPFPQSTIFRCREVGKRLEKMGRVQKLLCSKCSKVPIAGSGLRERGPSLPRRAESALRRYRFHRRARLDSDGACGASSGPG